LSAAVAAACTRRWMSAGVAAAITSPYQLSELMLG
jgi:hypothetical protein